MVLERGVGVPSRWAKENPQASPEKSPTDSSNRRRDPANGRAAKPVGGVWYFLDHRQSLCNTKETQRNDWSWGTEPATSFSSLCQKHFYLTAQRACPHPAAASECSLFKGRTRAFTCVNQIINVKGQHTAAQGWKTINIFTVESVKKSLPLKDAAPQTKQNFKMNLL